MIEPYCSRCKRELDQVGIYFPAELALRFYGGGEPIFLCGRCPTGDERQFVIRLLQQGADLEETPDAGEAQTERDTARDTG
jgi:hypothetical protein